MASHQDHAAAPFRYRRVVMPRRDGPPQTVIVPETADPLPVDAWAAALWRHAYPEGTDPDIPAATAAPPGAPRMVIETNPYHPLAHYRQVVIPGLAGKNRTAIVPATADALPVDAWALLLARHVQATAAPRLAVEPQFTVNLADPLQTALLDQVRQSPQADRLVVRTYTQPVPAARQGIRQDGSASGLMARVRTPEEARQLAAQVDARLADLTAPETEGPRPDQEAAFQARFHPSERAAKDYTGSYFGVLMPEDEVELEKARRAYWAEHQDEWNEVGEATRWSRQFRLVEVHPDAWAIWRLAPKGESFDRGYFVAQRQNPHIPWSGSLTQALDALSEQARRRFPAVRNDPESPDVIVEGFRRQ
ncbi:hypothetical protein, partial [Methylacidiphilum caldifontis]|uniref:hypothetical protein n=1 Tax=Methylacidiphilum caldifontis TaxID=2795386 RepID=UPI00106D47A6